MLSGRKRTVVLAAFAGIAVLIWAWIDGGKRDVHPVEVEVALPETAQ